MNKSEQAVDELVRAIKHTVDYVGNRTLPAHEGWSWFDALRKHAPEVAQEYIQHPVLVEQDERMWVTFTVHGDDEELRVMQVLVQAIEGLDDHEGRGRVLAWALERYAPGRNSHDSERSTD